jgi:hypothetical protein
VGIRNDSIRQQNSRPGQKAEPAVFIPSLVQGGEKLLQFFVAGTDGFGMSRPGSI